MTGFFINTNKTADINKEESDKGYDIPWQYEESQYWLAKLRDWQENKKLKRENSLLKEQTTLTIDIRPINDISRNKDLVIVETSYNLTDTEIDALKNAISNEFMNHQGWTTDNYERVKENGIQVYKAGYVTAIQKILNEI